MGLFHSRHSDLERKSTGVSNNKDDAQFGFMIYTCASLPATCFESSHKSTAWWIHLFYWQPVDLRQCVGILKKTQFGIQEKSTKKKKILKNGNKRTRNSFSSAASDDALTLNALMTASRPDFSSCDSRSKLFTC